MVDITAMPARTTNVSSTASLPVLRVSSYNRSAIDLSAHAGVETTFPWFNMDGVRLAGTKTMTVSVTLRLLVTHSSSPGGHSDNDDPPAPWTIAPPSYKTMVQSTTEESHGPRGMW